MLDAYRPLLDGPQNYELAELEVLGELLEGTRHRAEYSRLKEQIPAEYQRRGQIQGMKQALHKLFRMGGDRAREREFDDLQQRAYEQENRGRACLRADDWANAVTPFQEAQGLFRKLREAKRALFCTGCLAQALYQRGNWDEALQCARQHELMSRECGEVEDLAESLSLETQIHLNRENLGQAEQLLDEVATLDRDYGLPHVRQKSVAMRALLLSKRGDDAGGLRALREAEQRFAACGDLESALTLRPAGHPAGPSAWAPTGSQ